ncbi:MAG: tetratricopeptide repeat protein [Verrucomicrobiales bacterium]|nr:tetratricopeptide repeat protein [Verrucomicrobiales bacterium]
MMVERLYRTGGLPGLFLAGVIALTTLLGESIQGQEEDLLDPVVAYNKTISAIDLEQWDRALKITDGIIAEYDSIAMKRFGPVFGHFHFLRGLALLGKKNYDSAIKSFDACYTKYDNKFLEQMNDEERQGLLPNLFRNSALVQWANSEMRREKYAAAAKLYEKILVEAKNDKKVNLVYVGVNLGRCYLKAGQLQKGYDFMVKPLSNENLSDGLRETIFMVMAEDWSTEVEFPPTRSFIQKFSNVVDQDPFIERYERNERFQYLAQLALQNKDIVRSLAWYERMVNPRLLAPELQQQYASLENRPVPEQLEEKKKEALAELRKQIRDLDTQYLQILNGVGSNHFMMQNYPASYVAFSRLSDQAGKTHKQRPVFLHNAVVSAAQVELWKEAYVYGRQFLDEFPDHELKPGVARVLVEVLFLREEYQDSYDVSGEVRQSMDPGEEIRDIPDFVYGASAFHLGHIEEAETELSSYFQVYPNGTRKELAHFFLGLAKVRLAKWQEAADTLNSFLETYPTSTLVPTVLYQCAMSEFMIDLPEEALVKVNRVHSEFPNMEVAPPCWNLKGDILASQGAEFLEVEPCYLNGRDGGREMGQPDTTAYALWQLLVQTVELSQWEKAAQHYREFQADHAESDFRYDVLVTALPMLVEEGRTEEGLTKLRDVVWENREDPESVVLAEMFGSYVDFLKENYDLETLLAELEELQMKRGSSAALMGWTLIARVDALEETEAEQAAIDQYFYRLEAGFKPEEQSNYPTVRLARWISDVRKRPEEAKKLYDFILENRPGTANYEYCLVDVAQIQAASDDAAQREEAMQKFQRVLAEIPNEELQEKSVLGMARIRTEEEKYDEAQSLWEKYLENRSWNLARPEANYQLGYCMDQLGNTADALKIYVSVYANFPGYLDWSTRAYLRTAAIMKGTGEDLKALKVLQDMLKRMGHHDHPGVKRGKELFVKWRREFEATQGANPSAKG